MRFTEIYDHRPRKVVHLTNNEAWVLWGFDKGRITPYALSKQIHMLPSNTYRAVGGLEQQRLVAAYNLSGEKELTKWGRQVRNVILKPNGRQARTINVQISESDITL